MNRGAKREELRSALTSQRDPYQVASLLVVTSVALQQSKPEPNLPQTSDRSFQDSNGNEWAAILKAWLDTQELAMAVRIS
jgi:hypothetical protein